MQLKRTLVLGAAGGAFAAWIASAAMPGVRSMPEVRVAPPTPVERHGAALDAEIARLRERLRPTAQPRQPARNLFSFAEAPGARQLAAPAPARAVVASQELEPVRAVAPPPPITLIGFAENHEADGVVRTAIVAVHGDVFLVKAGESVDGYRVTAVDIDGVALTDPANGSTITLHLK